MIYLLLFILPAFAELDRYDTQALEQTKQLLVSPSERAQAIKSDSKAQEADKELQSVAGSDERKQKLYELSAKIFESTTQQTNGGDQTELMQNAMKDPKAFFESLSPEQQRELSGIANEIHGSADLSSKAQKP